MTPLDQAIETVRELVNDLGVDEVARLSGVPISTLYDGKRRGFAEGTIKVLKKLLDLAEKRRAENSSRAA